LNQPVARPVDPEMLAAEHRQLAEQFRQLEEQLRKSEHLRHAVERENQELQAKVRVAGEKTAGASQVPTLRRARTQQTLRTGLASPSPSQSRAASPQRAPRQANKPCAPPPPSPAINGPGGYRATARSGPKFQHRGPAGRPPLQTRKVPQSSPGRRGASERLPSPTQPNSAESKASPRCYTWGNEPLERGNRGMQPAQHHEELLEHSEIRRAHVKPDEELQNIADTAAADAVTAALTSKGSRCWRQATPPQGSRQAPKTPVWAHWPRPEPARSPAQSNQENQETQADLSFAQDRFQSPSARPEASRPVKHRLGPGRGLVWPSLDSDVEASGVMSTPDVRRQTSAGAVFTFDGPPASPWSPDAGFIHSSALPHNGIAAAAMAAAQANVDHFQRPQSRAMGVEPVESRSYSPQRVPGRSPPRSGFVRPPPKRAASPGAKAGSVERKPPTCSARSPLSRSPSPKRLSPSASRRPGG